MNTREQTFRDEVLRRFELLEQKQAKILSLLEVHHDALKAHHAAFMSNKNCDHIWISYTPAGHRKCSRCGQYDV